MAASIKFVLWWKLVPLMSWLILMISDTTMVSNSMLPDQHIPLDADFTSRCCCNLSRSWTGYHQACRSDGSWVNVQFIEYRYRYVSDTGISKDFKETDIQSNKFVHSVDSWEIDFPSIVFAYKPDDGKGLYDRIKTMSNYIGGIQSQCAVAKKFESQKNKDQ